MLYELDGVRPTIAADAWVAPDAAVIGDVTLGARSTIWFLCTVRGDTNRITIGDRTNVQDGSVLTIGHACIIHACTLESGAFVGMGATVLDGAVIESGGMLAAGALLTPGKRIPAGELWGGSPARKMRVLSAEDRLTFDNIAVHYAERGQIYRRSLKAIG